MPEYVIVAGARDDENKKLILADPNKVGSSSFWTFKIAEAKVYNDLRAAEHRQSLLKFGKPQIMTAEEAAVAIRENQRARASLKRAAPIANPVLTPKRRAGEQ